MHEIRKNRSFKMEDSLYDEAKDLLQKHRGKRISTFIYESIFNEIKMIKKELEETK